MEAIKTTVQNIHQKQTRPQASSQTAPIAKPISNEKMTAMGDVIDRWRLNKGWNPYDNDSQMMAIQSWVNVMDSENIPATAYNKLFVRALKLRASLMAQGKQPPEMGVDLMLACWDSLRAELEAERIESGKYLPQNAESVCRHCQGTGFKRIKASDGYFEARKCNHEGEPA